MKVQFEITNACNYACKMCPRTDFHKVPIKHMETELYKKILARLPNSYSITLTGWGEPFTHPEIYEIIKHTQDKGHKVSLTSNGALIDPKKVIDCGLDSIHFSIDSVKGSEWGHSDEGLKKIKELLELKKKIKSKTPEIVFQSVVINPKDVVEVAKLGKKWGVNRINLTMLDERMGNIKNLKKKEVMGMLKELKKVGIRFDLAQYAIGSGLKRIVYMILKPFLLRWKCLRTISYLYINVDGFVTPCCNMPRYTLKKALDYKDIKEVFSYPKYKCFQKNWKNICKGCDIFEPLK